MEIQQQEDLTFEPFTKDNVQIAGEVQYEIFHEIGFSAYADYFDEGEGSLKNLHEDGLL